MEEMENLVKIMEHDKGGEGNLRSRCNTRNQEGPGRWDQEGGGRGQVCDRADEGNEVSR